MFRLNIMENPDNITIEQAIVSVYNEDEEGERILDDFEREMTHMENDDNEGAFGVPPQNIFYYHDGNSPMTMSPYNSDDEVDNKGFRELSCEEIEQELEKYYNQNDSLIMNELDAMMTYIKGQKHLFQHAKQYSEYNLNLLIVPSILISAFIAMFSSFFEPYYWNHGFIAGLNALVALCISFANYFKLERICHGYYLSALQYDKIETNLQFVSSKIAFMKEDDPKEEIILHKITETEEKICEIKEWNHLFIPNYVQYHFPIISHLNIFSFIKRLETNKKAVLLRFQHVKNEIRYIQYYFRKHSNTLVSEEKNRMQQRLMQLFQFKESLKSDLYCYRNAYSYLDNLFNNEIRNAENRNTCFGWMYSNEKKDLSMKNHIVDAFFEL